MLLTSARLRLSRLGTVPLRCAHALGPKPVDPTAMYEDWVDAQRTSQGMPPLRRSDAQSYPKVPEYKAPDEIAGKAATEAALAVRPTFPDYPWKIDLSIPHVRDVNTGQMVPKYDPSLVKETSNRIMDELRADCRKRALHDPWAQHYAYAYHPFFSFRNQIRYMFPGLKNAVLLFIVYCVGEAIYDLTAGAKKGRGH